MAKSRRRPCRPLDESSEVIKVGACSAPLTPLESTPHRGAVHGLLQESHGACDYLLAGVARTQPPKTCRHMRECFRGSTTASSSTFIGQVSYPSAPKTVGDTASLNVHW